MAKAVARKNRMTVAKEVLTDPVTKKHVVEMLGKELASEVRSMASDGANSILQSLNTRHLKEFSWNLLMDELSKIAPLLMSLLFQPLRGTKFLILTLYHLCGDNLDKCIKQRYMRVGCKKPDSIHYFHSYAVADRVDFNHLCDQVIPTLQRDAKQLASFLLPTLDDDAALRNNIICGLMSRILYANMEFFQHSFDGVVDWHIKHEFYDEMSTCSKVVSIEIKIIAAETMYTL